MMVFEVSKLRLVFRHELYTVPLVIRGHGL
jgi:hypothetical protein